MLSPLFPQLISFLLRIPPQGLANIFSGLSIYLPKTIADYYKLKRYVVAYDGDVLTDFNKEQIGLAE